MKEYIIQVGFDYKREKSSRTRANVMCISSDCNQRLHSLKVIDNHKIMVKNVKGKYTYQKVDKQHDATVL